MLSSSMLSLEGGKIAVIFVRISHKSERIASHPTIGITAAERELSSFHFTEPSYVLICTRDFVLEKEKGGDASSR